MTTFIDRHYRTAFPHARVRTAALAVTHKWISDPTKLPPDMCRLYATARLGILPVNANRQPRTNNPRRQCPHCAVIETPTHTYSACARYINQRRLRHDNAITCVIPHLAAAATTICHGRSTWIRERSLTRLQTPNASDDDDTTLLRPDLYHLDHHRRVVTAIEFTIPDN